jgi:hypothetical protein
MVIYLYIYLHWLKIRATVSQPIQRYFRVREAVFNLECIS